MERATARSIRRLEREVGTPLLARAGRVRLASFPSSSATLVPAALARLRTSHPLVGVSLVEAEPPTSLSLLRRGDCDLALTFEYPGVASDEAEQPLPRA